MTEPAYRRGPRGATLPIQPLIERMPDSMIHRKGVPNRGPAAELHERTGLSITTIQRYLSSGVIPHEAADLCAIRIDSHPVIIWPDYHDTHPVPQQTRNRKKNQK